jgi:uncharacterized membrane protein (DUF485 family)
MSQTRRRSALEALAQITVGYLVSVCGNILFLPMFGLNPSVADSFGIGIVFSVISFVRSYVLRRVFNMWENNMEENAKLKDAIVLLRAVLEIMTKAKESPYIEDVLSLTAFYDGVECDGGCLMQDIKDYLGVED